MEKPLRRLVVVGTLWTLVTGFGGCATFNWSGDAEASTKPNKYKMMQDHLDQLENKLDRLLQMQSDNERTKIRQRQSLESNNQCYKHCMNRYEVENRAYWDDKNVGPKAMEESPIGICQKHCDDKFQDEIPVEWRSQGC